MPLEKIYIARHGFRLNWVTTTWKSATGLLRDPPLAAYGETQAKHLAEYFKSLPEEERPTAIFSSPYCANCFFGGIERVPDPSAQYPYIDRCLQTAQPTAQTLGIPLYVEHGISEWYSPVKPGTGLHPRPGSAASLKPYFSEIDPAWSPVWYPSQKGEGVLEVHDRTDGFLEVFFPQLERAFPGRHKRILLVSHAATVITLVRSLVGDKNLPLRVGCCSLTELVPQPQENGLRDGKQRVLGTWVAKKLADGGHLPQGELREWGFEDIEIEAGKVVDDPGVPGSEGLQEGPMGSQVAHSLL